MGKIVITGTGRCGTSFLMQLFTELGFNTGYTADECKQHLERSACNGGIEHVVGTELFEKSDIVKNPVWLYEPELLDDIDVDLLIIPVRNFEKVAKSRERIGHGKYGGFWRGATNVKEQIKIDKHALACALIEFVKKDIEFLLLDFEKIMNRHYMRKKIMPFLISLDPWFGDGSKFQAQMRFVECHERIAKPELIHF